MRSPTTHVDCFYSIRVFAPDSGNVSFANGLVVIDRVSERSKPNDMRNDGNSVFRGYPEREARTTQKQVQDIRSFGVSHQLERVLDEKIVDRDISFQLKTSAEVDPNIERH